MSLFHAVILAIVQAVTEFLPISSDGHLILVPSLLGWERFGLGFDVALHVGTLLATIAYFRGDVIALLKGLFSRGDERLADRRLAWLLVGATVPSALVVFAMKAFIDGIELLSVERQIELSAWGLIITTAALVISERIASSTRHRPDDSMVSENLSWPRALAIGTIQGFAALPGVSRSGLTIAAGQSLGMSRGEAARFSFLMSMPIIGAATAAKALDIVQGEAELPGVGITIVAVAVTAIAGYAVIHFLLPFVRKHSLMVFAVYTSVLGGILLTITYLR